MFCENFAKFLRTYDVLHEEPDPGACLLLCDDLPHLGEVSVEAGDPLHSLLHPGLGLQVQQLHKYTI